MTDNDKTAPKTLTGIKALIMETSLAIDCLQQSSFQQTGQLEILTRKQLGTLELLGQQNSLLNLLREDIRKVSLLRELPRWQWRLFKGLTLSALTLMVCALSLTIALMLIALGIGL